jgi:hypothetical protein
MNCGFSDGETPWLYSELVSGTKRVFDWTHIEVWPILPIPGTQSTTRDATLLLSSSVDNLWNLFSAFLVISLEK